MVDSVMVFVPGGMVRTDFLKDIQPRGDQGLLAKLANLRIKEGREGCVIKGSLPKYLRGENITHFSREEFRASIDKLGVETGLDLSRSVLFQVEIGETIPVDRPPREYMASWGVMPYLSKATFGNGSTVTYLNKQRSYSGYDKRQESYGSPIPEDNRDNHALRLEFRIKKGLHKTMGRQLGVYDLAEPDIYKDLVRKWARLYSGIPKAKRIRLEPCKMAPRSFERSLAAIGLQAFGLDRIEGFISDSQHEGYCTAVAASRMRRLSRDMLHDPRVLDTDQLTMELDGKVHELESMDW